jgi:hypothetical protein
MDSTRLSKFVALFVFLTLRVALAQSAPATGIVEGRVTCEDTGVPARLAIVRLYPLANYLPKTDEPKPRAPDPASTDFDGNFQFVHVWPGIFLVKVEEDGYNKNFEFTLHNLDLFPATRQREVLSQLPQVTVKSGGISRVDVVIHHSAAISGHVSFDSGGALIGPNGDITATLVRSDLLKDDNGQPLQNGSSGLFTESAAPDDRGIYRIAGLPPGEYRIDLDLHGSAARLSGTQNENRKPVSADLTVFAPDALSQNKAKLVEVEEGGEVSDVDITIPLSRLHSISGVIVQHRSANSNLFLTLRAVQPDGSTHEINGGIRLDSGGSFRFDLLPSGSYIIEVKNLERTSETKLASLTVVVGETDVLDANIDLGYTTPHK